MLNGLVHSNDLLREEAFKLEDWKIIGEYVYDSEGGRHQAFYTPVKDVWYKDIQFKAGERIQVEQSLKYTSAEALRLWECASLNESKRWSASADDYSKSCCFYSLFFIEPHQYPRYEALPYKSYHLHPWCRSYDLPPRTGAFGAGSGR